MSETDTRDYREYEAPITWPAVFLRLWWIWLIGIAAILYIFLANYIPPSVQYGYWCFIGVFLVTWFLLSRPEGFALDTRDLADGHLSLVPLDRWELERHIENQKVLTFKSESGIVVLTGHKLLSYDDAGNIRMHPELELQTNSAIASAVSESQVEIYDKFLMYERNARIEANRQFAEMVKIWKQKMMLDPEQQKRNSDVEPSKRSTD